MLLGGPKRSPCGPKVAQEFPQRSQAFPDAPGAPRRHQALPDAPGSTQEASKNPRGAHMGASGSPRKPQEASETHKQLQEA